MATYRIIERRPGEPQWRTTHAGIGIEKAAEISGIAPEGIEWAIEEEGECSTTRDNWGYEWPTIVVVQAE